MNQQISMLKIRTKILIDKVKIYPSINLEFITRACLTNGEEKYPRIHNVCATIDELPKRYPKWDRRPMNSELIQLFYCNVDNNIRINSSNPSMIYINIGTDINVDQFLTISDFSGCDKLTGNYPLNGKARGGVKITEKKVKSLKLFNIIYAILFVARDLHIKIKTDHDLRQMIRKYDIFSANHLVLDDNSILPTYSWSRILPL